LLETALSQLIVKALSKKELQDIFSRLEMSNKKTGKLAFIKSLGLLDSGEIKFVYCLSELRNKLVHNIDNVTFNIKEHITKLDKNQFKEFMNICFFYIPSAFKKESIRRFIKGSPKLAIFLGTYNVLKKIYMEKQIAIMVQEKRKISEDILKKMLEVHNYKKR